MLLEMATCLTNREPGMKSERSAEEDSDMFFQEDAKLHQLKKDDLIKILKYQHNVIKTMKLGS